MKTTREQQRAYGAHQRVSAVAPGMREEYGRQCLHLPALIHESGLCQALAFMEAKGANPKKPHFMRLLEDLAAVGDLGASAAVMTKRAREAELAEYQHMTREALACAQWFKRYAEAVLKAELGSDKGEK